MKVSVAMATYNGSGFLREQLSSIVGQTMPPAELVVSDDGSTDDTLEIVRDFAKTAPFPVVVASKTERLGFADNFLYAAEACRHELVAFCDQDDVWLPGKIETGVKRICDDASLMALHTLTITDSELKPTGHWTQGIIADKAYEPLELDPYSTGWGNSMMFRREIATLMPRQRRPHQPEKPILPLSHDTWLYMLAAALGRVSHIKAPLLLYRQHGLNAWGVEVSKPKNRLKTMKSVPIERFRGQALINDQMTTLFAELAEQPGPYAVAAREAADRFAERHAWMFARVRMFDGKSFGARLRAYRAYYNLAEQPRPWIGSRIKSLTLGVAGLGASRR
jgi:glycosyltransferase involved in cell wall biosynthesis